MMENPTVVRFDENPLIHEPLPDSLHLDYPPKSEVSIFNGGYKITFMNERPNWWWRMWQYLLLGWKWTDLTKKSGK